MKPTNYASEVRRALRSGFTGFAWRFQSSRGDGGVLRCQARYLNNLAGISIFMENARYKVPATLFFFFFFLMISPEYEQSLTLRFSRTLKPPQSPGAPYSHFLSPSLDSKHHEPGTSSGFTNYCVPRISHSARRSGNTFE